MGFFMKHFIPFFYELGLCMGPYLTKSLAEGDEARRMNSSSDSYRLSHFLHDEAYQGTDFEEKMHPHTTKTKR